MVIGQYAVDSRQKTTDHYRVNSRQTFPKDLAEKFPACPSAAYWEAGQAGDTVKKMIIQKNGGELPTGSCGKEKK